MTKSKNDDFPIDLEGGVRRALKNTIFAHPDDLKKSVKATTPTKKKGR